MLYYYGNIINNENSEEESCVLQTRIAGVLMPVSALPSKEGIGTLGKDAYRFIDYIKQSGFSLWQVLPLVPTNYGDSPYQSCSSEALNYYFIDLQTLVEEGLLTAEDYAAEEFITHPRRVDYGKLFEKKVAVLKKAFARFDREDKDFQAFVAAGKYDDFALFMSLKEGFSHRAWQEWPEEFRNYNEERMRLYAHTHRESLLFWQFTQFVFLKQWKALKAYANAQGIAVMGDMPLYVAMDSAEVWKYGNELFLMDEDKNPTAVAGVPPDAFSEDGQLWGNPLYNWNKMEEDGYRWWRARIASALKLYDLLRIDHFRGFDRYFAVPVGAESAREGLWQHGPKEKLFLPEWQNAIVAEDLGTLDEGVYRLMELTGYPGMRVLSFGFDGSPACPHVPSAYPTHCIAYTGTHDNEPLRAFIENFPDREWIVSVLKRECEPYFPLPEDHSPKALTLSAVRLLYASKANICILPLWDALALGAEARINFPSTVSPANWSYRFMGEDFTQELSIFLRDLASRYKRL